MHSKEGCCWPGSLCPSCCSLLLGQAWDCAGPWCASPAWCCCQKMRSSACSRTGLLVGWWERGGGHCFPASDRGKVLCSCASLVVPGGVVSLWPATPPSHLPSARCMVTARPGCPRGRWGALCQAADTGQTVLDLAVTVNALHSSPYCVLDL